MHDGYSVNDMYSPHAAVVA